MTKFNKRNDRVSKEGNRPGFNDSDITSLSKVTYTPKTQIWSAEELESEDPEDRHYFCAMCKGVLDYNTKLEAYYCSSCVQWYDTRIQDVPLKDIKDFQLVPYGEQRHYPQFDANDPMTPFVEAVNLDDNANENMEGVEIRSYDQGRIQHINIHNVTFADAIKYSNVLSAQKKGEELD